ncbi:sigma 54 modulation/S30EA ribosomal C-terminal domain-containing protein [Pseudonocardia abyssalis]|uniref:sigma 54 modulation/S30EA ribosomal C-terminal domain-containing protein n=1 Tax=Pseudonocardia abyssalis TaxID=2792008 RepID=UPI001C49EE1D|nr:sigma 54 modulation/S30EA ribosomal C-terminal domain-containing protein [Pseudonocardia abyssalis]MBW0113857.1 sigma 54 modulation/S30EA ribosomal C-terminal domain-containing protein [Pseudonocardia abyssalis]
MSEIVVEVRGSIADDLAAYARGEVADALTRTRRPVPRVHVRVLKHGDPARVEPVTAHANVDLDGRPLLVHAAAATPRAAVDLLVERLEHRLARLSRDRRPRRVRADEDAGPGPSEPEIVRHATSSPAPLSVDGAVAEMEDLGLDFHLFVEASTGQDAVVYRDGPTGLRLSRAGGGPDPVGSHDIAVTVSAQPAPLLDTAEAVERLRVTGLPFVFYLDGDHGRANVLYHRDDGDYGLIDPARR